MELNVESIYKALLTEAIEKGKVIDAIKTNSEVTIYYAGDETVNKGYRVIQPFCFGVNKSGNPCIRAWQTNGATDTPNGSKADDPLTRMPGWRMFRLDRISTFNKTTNRFDVSKKRLDGIKYNPSDRDMSTIYVAVQPLDDNGLTQQNKPTDSNQKKSFFNSNQNQPNQNQGQQQQQTDKDKPNPDSNQTNPNGGIGGGFFKSLKDQFKSFFK
jgi:hypothetical protein